MSVDGVSEPGDLGHSAQPPDPCDTGGARTPERVQDPRAYTQAEVDEHNMTHLPYRSWCTHCVRGRGEAHPHHKFTSLETRSATTQSSI